VAATASTRRPLAHHDPERDRGVRERVAELEEEPRGDRPVNPVADEYRELDERLTTWNSARRPHRVDQGSGARRCADGRTAQGNRPGVRGDQRSLKKLFERPFEGGLPEPGCGGSRGGRRPARHGVELMASRAAAVQAVTLMSGGEKALTGLALLFAIFYHRPSPFCVLDEVDAPLDDANIHRFLRVLRELCTQTQFVVITHNRKTMEAADVLYGVTMEEPGLSRLVSVNMTAQ
jgi:chromosome segregation protein